MHVNAADVSIIVGVDTHKDIHVAVALDALGRRLAELELPTTTTGYQKLHVWATGLGQVDAFGVEGTGSYGAGLTRYLRRCHGSRVIEVNRPDRATRHRKGKSDTIDAEAAARAVLAGTSTGTPKTGDDQVEIIRMLKLARDSAVKAQTQAVNPLKAVLVTAPDELRQSLNGLGLTTLLDRCASLRPGALSTPLAAAKHTLRLLARRAQAMRLEAQTLRDQLGDLTAVAAPALIELTGVGPDTAAALLLSAGDNPQRLHSEAAFAALCGTNPVPASSGKTTRYRLNRGGDRQANAALHRAVLTECTGTNRPRPTSSGAPPKANPSPRSCAVSSATWPGRSTAASKPTSTQHRRPTVQATAKTSRKPFDGT